MLSLNLVFPAFDNGSPLSHSLELYRLCRFLHPFRALELGFAVEDIAGFDIFKCVQNGIISLEELQKEYPLYISLASKFDKDSDMMEIYWNNTTRLPTLCKFYMLLLLLQPSSASVERAFSLLNHMLNDQQHGVLQDYLEAEVMLAYNHRN